MLGFQQINNYWLKLKNIHLSICYAYADTSLLSIHLIPKEKPFPLLGPRKIVSCMPKVLL